MFLPLLCHRRCLFQMPGLPRITSAMSGECFRLFVWRNTCIQTLNNKLGEFFTAFVFFYLSTATSEWQDEAKGSLEKWSLNCSCRECLERWCESSEYKHQCTFTDGVNGGICGLCVYYGTGVVRLCWPICVLCLISLTKKLSR